MVNVFWFRRDLRLNDNVGLFHALKEGIEVQPIFIFDKNILDQLDVDDARVSFIHSTLNELNSSLQTQFGAGLRTYFGEPLQIINQLVRDIAIQNIFANHDYEPYAIERDEKVTKFLSSKNIGFRTYKDHVIFEKGEVVKNDQSPYTVFTPYKRKWYEKLESDEDYSKSSFLKSYPSEKMKNYKILPDSAMLSLEDIGFVQSHLNIPSKVVARKKIKEYSETRDYPSVAGTSRLGIHFRFGTISIREKVRTSMKLNDIYVNELIWREFYAQILHHFPHVVLGAFRKKYDAIPWRNNEAEYNKWMNGETGFSLVDAGMRELNSTGHMHNRVRMVVASFLTKHLLIDWRWGEAYFAKKLLDFDLASNNGGWQWVAGCGTDASPYFRIFNPESQMKKFDKNLQYVRKWVPEFGTEEYINPIVDHKEVRLRCLAVYKEALINN